MLEVKDVHTYYGDSHILHGVTLTVHQGHVRAVLGRNGVGKTTLMHSIVSFVKPSKGRILVGGEEITGLSTHRIMRKGVTLVPQGRRVFKSLSVAENLTIPFLCAQEEGQAEPWGIEKVYETFPTLRPGNTIVPVT